MATKRNKKQAKKVRSRTAARKVVMRIRRLEENVDPSVARDTFEYWYAAVSQLSKAQLGLAMAYLNESNFTPRWYYRVDLFEVAKEAIATSLLEKTIGIDNV